MAKVFISYSRRDVEFSRQLDDKIRAMGYETWIDTEDIPKGAPWDNSIDSGLKQSDIIVGVLSPDSVASDNVKNEWGWALTYDKPLLLLMLHPCEVPHRYVRINYIDFTKSPQDGFNQLQTALVSVDRSMYQDDAAELSSATLSTVPKARFTRRALVLGLIGLLALGGIAAVAIFGAKPGNTACLSGMVEIPAGDFWMGAAPGDPDAEDDEKPATVITLDGFCIDRTEVSNRQYAEFVKAVNFTPPPGWIGAQYPVGMGDFPVVNVIWTDANAYCNWAHKQLPTEAQWEKAARGADLENPILYPWGGTTPEPDRANSAYTRLNAPMAVESFPIGASPYGVLNMAGNVAEWVADYYQDDWYVRIPKVNPTGPAFAVDGIHVIRGGDFTSGEAKLRVSDRDGVIASHLSAIVLNFVGIRCASDLKT